MLFVIITIVLSALIGGILWLARVQAHKLIHPKRRRVNRTPESVGILSWEDVSFTTSDGLTLRGWFIPPSPFADGETVIAVHGFTSNRTRFLEPAAVLNEQGYGVLLFDLRNHGESEGNVTSLGLHEVQDVRAAVAYVRSRHEVNSESIALLGHSMGAATILQSLPSLPNVTAVVVVAPFSSLAENISHGVKAFIGSIGLFFTPLIIYFSERGIGGRVEDVSPLETLQKIKGVPMLFIHGSEDKVLPVENSQRLSNVQAHNATLHKVTNAGHSTVLSGAFFPSYQQVLSGFLETHLRKELELEPCLDHDATLVTA